MNVAPVIWRWFNGTHKEQLLATDCSLKFPEWFSLNTTDSLGAKKYNWPDHKLFTFFFVNHFVKKKGTWTQNMIKTAFP